jgi:hypothetical protein
MKNSNEQIREMLDALIYAEEVLREDVPPNLDLIPCITHLQAVIRKAKIHQNLCIAKDCIKNYQEVGEGDLNKAISCLRNVIDATYGLLLVSQAPNTDSLSE